MPLECRGSRSCCMNNSCIGSSKAMSCVPSRRSRPLARMRASVGSMLSGSMVSGCPPSSPASTARSVPLPAPVRASEPYSRTAISLVACSNPSRRRLSANSRAARIGPMVCELDGPIPTLKMSKTLRLMTFNLAPTDRSWGAIDAYPVCNVTLTLSCFATTLRGSNATPQPAQPRPRALVRPLRRARSKCGGEPHAGGKRLAPCPARLTFRIAAGGLARRSAPRRHTQYLAFKLQRAAHEIHGIAAAHLVRRLYALAVDVHPAAVEGLGGERARAEQAHREQPAVDARSARMSCGGGLGHAL